MKRRPLFDPRAAWSVLVLAVAGGCLNQGVSPEDAGGASAVLTDIRTWATTYGGGGSDRPYDIRQTMDLGFIVVGETDSVGIGKDAWAMKQDSDGNLEWSKAYGGGGGIQLHGLSGLDGKLDMLVSLLLPAQPGQQHCDADQQL